MSSESGHFGRLGPVAASSANPSAVAFFRVGADDRQVDQVDGKSKHPYPILGTDRFGTSRE